MELCLPRYFKQAVFVRVVIILAHRLGCPGKRHQVYFWKKYSSRLRDNQAGIYIYDLPNHQRLRVEAEPDSV